MLHQPRHGSTCPSTGKAGTGQTQVQGPPGLYDRTLTQNKQLMWVFILVLFQFFVCLFVYFETGFHSVAQAGLELKEIHSLCLLRTRIKAVHHHSQQTRVIFQAWNEAGGSVRSFYTSMWYHTGNNAASLNSILQWLPSLTVCTQGPAGGAIPLFLPPLFSWILAIKISSDFWDSVAGFIIFTVLKKQM